MPHSRNSDTSKEIIYKALRRAIIMGHCRPGERLSVEAIAEEYGTSVTPARDALQMLSQEGLVTIKPRSGYFVAQVTLKELRDLLELRQILEVAAVERAAQQITDEQITQLEHVHAGYTGDDDESYERYTDENRRFHCLVAEASGNQALSAALGRLHDRLARFMVMRRAGQTMEHTHARIIEALRQHDVDMARQAMLSELNESRQDVIDQVIRQEGASWSLA
ncbi:MAG TPA: GntR family transcriptional regulator [Chloroflexi bacterium]|nr:GntR family transcriptional regulator [Chloroflexota bacterium]